MVVEVDDGCEVARCLCCLAVFGYGREHAALGLRLNKLNHPKVRGKAWHNYTQTKIIPVSNQGSGGTVIL